MRDWSLARIIYTADRGFTSQANRHELMRGGDGYILGEKLRSNSADAKAALSRPGKYRTVAGNMRVKEVRLGEATGAPIGSSSASTLNKPTATPTPARPW